MKNEKERLEEDLSMLLDDIELYNEAARQWEHFGIKLEDYRSLDELEYHINTLQNEAMYLESCLRDYDA